MKESDNVVESKQPQENQQEQAAPTSKNQSQKGQPQQEGSGKPSSKESIERIKASIPPPREDYAMAESDVMPDIPSGQSSAFGTNASDITGVVVPGQKEQQQSQDEDKKASKGHHKKDADSGHKKQNNRNAPVSESSDMQQKVPGDQNHEKELKALKKKAIKAEKKVDKLKRKVTKAKKKDAKQSKQIKLHEKLSKAYSKLERRKKKLEEEDK